MPDRKPTGLKPVDPYANPQQYINQAVARLGAPLTDAQIQANAQGQLSPLIQALTDSISRQAAAGTAAIGGYTSELAKHLAPFQQNAANIYSGAEQSQAASDAALSAKLQGGGAQQAQDLGARLASINAPGATNAAVEGATQTGTGAGNALYATGSASLANLIASGAAEQSYAGKLPGLAGLQGGQQVGGLQAQLAGKLADQTGTLQAKVPDIVQGLQSQRSSLLGNRETLRQQLEGFFSDRGFKQQALAQEKAVLAGNTAKAQQSADYQTASLTERQRHDIATETAAQQRIRVQAQAAAAKAATKKNPALTPAKVADISRKAAIDAEDLYHGVTKPNSKDPANPTVVSYTSTYQDAIKTLTARYPSLGRQGVLALVNRWYKPGQYGRPQKPSGLTSKQQAATNAALNPTGALTGGQ